jgi:hypothetical protein
MKKLEINHFQITSPMIMNMGKCKKFPFLTPLKRERERERDVSSNYLDT